MLRNQKHGAVGVGVVLLGAIALAGCAESNEEALSPDSADVAENNRSPIEQLQAIPTELQAEIDALNQPITDIQSLIDQLTSIPERHGMDVADMVAIAKASLKTGTVQFDERTNLSQEAQTEIKDALKKLRNAVAGLKATPSKVTALIGKLPELSAQSLALAAKVTATATVTAANPFAGDSEKAKAKADIENVKQVQQDVLKVISEAQAKVVGLPGLATGALVKLRASLMGGTHDGQPPLPAAEHNEIALAATSDAEPAAVSKKTAAKERRVNLDENSVRGYGSNGRIRGC
jgi:flagellar motor switch/type III secretory pathway protein FliN